MNNKFEDEVASSILHHWYEQAPNDRIAHLIKDTTKTLLRELQDRLALHQINLGYWNFLRVLWIQDGLTKRQLSVETGLMEPTAFVALKRMEAEGLIYFEKRPDNKKNIYVYLTDIGRDLEKVLVPVAEEVNNIALAGISERDIKTTRKTLLTMIENLSTGGH